MTRLAVIAMGDQRVGQPNVSVIALALVETVARGVAVDAQYRIEIRRLRALGSSDETDDATTTQLGEILTKAQRLAGDANQLRIECEALFERAAAEDCRHV